MAQPSSPTAESSTDSERKLGLGACRVQQEITSLRGRVIWVDLNAHGGAVLCAGGRPLVVAHPSSPTAESFMELGAGLVREVAKMQRQQRNAVR